MIDPLKREAVRRAGLQREEPATIASLSVTTGAYTVTWHGATVGPLWSLTGARFAVGQVVKVLVERNRPVAVIP